jgi:hypothetical protein
VIAARKTGKKTQESKRKQRNEKRAREGKRARESKVEEKTGGKMEQEREDEAGGWHTIQPGMSPTAHAG